MPKDSSAKHRKQPHSASSSSSRVQINKLIEVISRSQQNYRMLVDNLDQAVFSLSLEGEVRVANRRLLEILGVSFQDLIGHRLSEFIEVPTLVQAERALPAFLEKGSWGGILPVRLKRGRELRYFDCWLHIADEGGEPASAIGWARDVTAQRESEVRFTELFESLREGIFFTEPDGRILDANPALVRILGYESKYALQTRNFRDVYENPSERDALVREMEEKGSVQNRELVLRRKDGALIRSLVSGFAIRDPFGRVLRFQGMLVDVTEQRATEKQLHQEQEFVRRLVESFPDIIVVLDREGRFTFASPRVQDVLGIPPGDLIGQPLAAQAAEEDRAKLTATFKSILALAAPSAPVESAEYRARHADGSWRTLRASISPLFDESGRIGSVVASLRDVTEWKLTEQQLAQKEKFAAMGQMMTGAAHELNNPLTAILGVTDLLLERVPDASTTRQLELILRQARRAAAIVQNLLAFSRPSAQGRTKIRLEEIVQQALYLHEAALTQKNITVKFQAPARLPLVEGDRNLLMQVFANIITNAEQAISGARDRGTLSVALALVGEAIRVTIADDGPGVPSVNIRKIFDFFFTTKRPGGGSGLGLAISLAVIKEHGGTIEVQSAPGKGASFCVSLPAAAEELPEAPSSIPTAPGARQHSDALRGQRLLVIDDEENIREIVYEGLSARGMIVENAENSEEMFSLLAANDFDAILCDFNLAEENGRQVFDRLRAQSGGPMPRFIFMTGDLLDSATVAELAAKGACLLQKPFHISALAELLAALLDPQPSRSS